MNKLEKEIKEFFKKAMDIELVDSPQILDNYLYIEFNDLIGDVKIRIPYPIDRNHFEKMDKAERMMFILVMIMKKKFGKIPD